MSKAALAFLAFILVLPCCLFSFVLVAVLCLNSTAMAGARYGSWQSTRPLALTTWETHDEADATLLAANWTESTADAVVPESAGWVSLGILLPALGGNLRCSCKHTLNPSITFPTTTRGEEQ